MIRAKKAHKACIFDQPDDLLPARPGESILTFDHDGNFKHDSSFACHSERSDTCTARTPAPVGRCRGVQVRVSLVNGRDASLRSAGHITLLTSAKPTNSPFL